MRARGSLMLLLLLQCWVTVSALRHRRQQEEPSSATASRNLRIGNGPKPPAPTPPPLFLNNRPSNPGSTIFPTIGDTGGGPFPDDILLPGGSLRTAAPTTSPIGLGVAVLPLANFTIDVVVTDNVTLDNLTTAVEDYIQAGLEATYNGTGVTVENVTVVATIVGDSDDSQVLTAGENATSIEFSGQVTLGYDGGSPPPTTEDLAEQQEELLQDTDALNDSLNDTLPVEVTGVDVEMPTTAVLLEEFSLTVGAELGNVSVSDVTTVLEEYMLNELNSVYNGTVAAVELTPSVDETTVLSPGENTTISWTGSVVFEHGSTVPTSEELLELQSELLDDSDAVNEALADSNVVVVVSDPLINGEPIVLPPPSEPLASFTLDFGVDSTSAIQYEVSTITVVLEDYLLTGLNSAFNGTVSGIQLTPSVENGGILLPGETVTIEWTGSVTLSEESMITDEEIAKHQRKLLADTETINEALKDSGVFIVVQEVMVAGEPVSDDPTAFPLANFTLEMQVSNDNNLEIFTEDVTAVLENYLLAGLQSVFNGTNTTILLVVLTPNIGGESDTVSLSMENSIVTLGWSGEVFYEGTPPKGDEILEIQRKLLSDREELNAALQAVNLTLVAGTMIGDGTPTIEFVFETTTPTVAPSIPILVINQLSTIPLATFSLNLTSVDTENDRNVLMTSMATAVQTYLLEGFRSRHNDEGPIFFSSVKLTPGSDVEDMVSFGSTPRSIDWSGEITVQGSPVPSEEEVMSLQATLLGDTEALNEVLASLGVVIATQGDISREPPEAEPESAARSNSFLDDESIFFGQSWAIAIAAGAGIALCLGLVCCILCRASASRVGSASPSPERRANSASGNSGPGATPSPAE